MTCIFEEGFAHFWRMTFYMIFTDLGLVLRDIKQSETDKILVILTKEHGKITAYAKGALNKSSKIKAACQSFVYSEFTIYVGGKDNFVVNDALTQTQFFPFGCEIETLSLAAYFGEILETLTDMDMHTERFLRLGLNCLYALSAKKIPFMYIKAIFEYMAVSFAGYEPLINECNACGAPPDNDAFFDITEGVIYCKNCNQDDLMLVPKPVLELMNFLSSCDDKKILSYKFNEKFLPELNEISEKYLEYHSDKEYKQLKYFKGLL